MLTSDIIFFDKFMSNNETDISLEKIENREAFMHVAVQRAIESLQLTAANEGVYNSYLISQLHLPKRICGVLIDCILANSNYAFKNINVVDTYTNSLVRFIQFAFENQDINNADKIIPRLVESLGKIENLESIFIATSSYDGDKPKGDVVDVGTAKHAIADIIVNMKKEEQTPAILNATSDVLIEITKRIERVPANQLSNIVNEVLIYFKKLRKFLRFLSLTESSEKLAVEFIRTIDFSDRIESTIQENLES